MPEYVLDHHNEGELDLDLSLIDARGDSLELHHVADAEAAIANLVASARPGGAILLIETDFLPVTGRYWSETTIELRDRLLAEDGPDSVTIDAFLGHCEDPKWWTQTIAFTGVSGRVPA